jgi:tRNA A-37 threonylcarbamoyl transferase component Bud32
MAGAASAGVRVPRVVELREDALVLERIDGPTMQEVLQRRPWQVRSLLRTLARLQEQVAAAGLVHLDLHPTNVTLSRSGPVVIDWTNASVSPPATVSDAERARVRRLLLRRAARPRGRSRDG